MDFVSLLFMLHNPSVSSSSGLVNWMLREDYSLWSNVIILYVHRRQLYLNHGFIVHSANEISAWFFMHMELKHVWPCILVINTILCGRYSAQLFFVAFLLSIMFWKSLEENHSYFIFVRQLLWILASTTDMCSVNT